MGETVAEIDESHFFQAHRIMTFFSEFSICNRSYKTAKKERNYYQFMYDYLVFKFHVVTVKKECGADCRRRNDSILTHPINMPANLLYRLWGHETVERWYH